MEQRRHFTVNFKKMEQKKKLFRGENYKKKSVWELITMSITQIPNFSTQPHLDSA